MKNIKLKYPIIIVVIFFISIFFLVQHKLPENNVDNKDLFGYWKGDYEENPGFEINKDHFITGDQKLNYKLNEDNITIYYSTFIFNGKFRIEKNTLFIESNGNTDVFHRWCEEINDICKN